MSAYDVIRFETPSSALRKLAAPSLRYLAMNFSPENQHDESAKDFDEEQVTWMKDFASLKKAKYPSSRLDKIFVRFCPADNLHWPYGNSPKDMTWPWEHLEQARQAVSEHGLTLEYSKPSWTKEEWDDIVRERETKRRAPSILEHFQPASNNLTIGESMEGNSHQE